MTTRLLVKQQWPVGETSGQAADTAARSCHRQALVSPAEETEAAPLVREADPELEKLLDEEETITRQTREANETPHFRGDD
jgi:small subunit ribosomal protein S3